jgi:hypothetical protein
LRKLLTILGLSALALSACGGSGTTPVSRTGTASQHRIALPNATRRRMDASGNLADPGFESGGFTYWQQCGNVNAAITTAKAHSGYYSERSGSSSTPEVNGDAGVCQQVTVPSNGHISFWVYQGTNETNTTYAYQEADFLDDYGYVLKNFYTTAANTSGWKQLSFDASGYAGQTVWLYFGVHGNGWSNGYIYQYVDDVAWGSSATPSPSPSASPTPTPKPSSSPTPVPTSSPTPTPLPSPSPTASAYPCNNQQFLTDQSEFASGQITSDQFVQVCGYVTQVLPSKQTTSGLHGYFYVQMPSGYNIEIVSNLTAMAQAPTNDPPSTWPWVAVGNYTYVQGRYYYDNSSSQGIDWTEDDTSSSWPHTGDVVVCDNNGNNCKFYW